MAIARSQYMYLPRVDIAPLTAVKAVSTVWELITFRKNLAVITTVCVKLVVVM